MKALFRVDASITLGSGHLMRCLALAKALKKLGWHCIFACSSSSESIVRSLSGNGFDIIETRGKADKQATVLGDVLPLGVSLLVVDHYQLDIEFEQTCRSWARTILVIDDLANRQHDADILIDQTHGRDMEDYVGLVPRHCKIFTGARYALLRPEFNEVRTKSLTRRDDTKPRINRVLVNFGGFDPDNVTSMVLAGVRDSHLDAIVDVVLTSKAPNLNHVRREVERLSRGYLHVDIPDMARLMAQADLAIGAGGMTSWERCCLGLPALVVTIADNQEKINEELSTEGATEYLGWYTDLEISKVSNAILQISSETEKLRSMSHISRSICDGKGVTRLVRSLYAEKDINTW